MSMMMQAGMFDLNASGKPVVRNRDLSRFHRINFPTPFPRGSKVIVIPMVQTFNGCNTPGVRIGAVDETGFCFRINELVADAPNTKAISDGHHVPETIGYVAMTAYQQPRPRRLCKGKK